MSGSRTRPAVERRAHARRLINIGIDLRVEDQPTRRCKLRELGPGGLLLGRAGVPGGLIPGMDVHLGLRVPPDADNGYFRLRARVVHTNEGDIGLEFLAAPRSFTSHLLSYLQSLDRQDAQALIKLQKDMVRTSAWRSRLRHAAIGRGNLVGMIDRLLDQGIACLRERAECSVSDEQRRQWEDDAALLDLACRERGLSHGITASLLQPLQAVLHESRVVQGETRIMDDGQAGLCMARQYLIETLEGPMAGRLSGLRDRLQPILIESGLLPLSPEAYADVLEQTLKDINLSPEGRILLLRVAAAPLLTALPTLYDSLIETA